MNDRVQPAIVVFPASNCERDMELILKELYGFSPLMIWHEEDAIPKNVTHLILPGGFSFGDHLRAGALAKSSLIMPAIRRFSIMGGDILGICNGFQILCELGLLPGALLKNPSDRFICKEELVTFFGIKKPLAHPKKLRLPIAHREGRYFAGPDTMADIKTTNLIALSYDHRDGDDDASVNGSKMGIGGLIGGPKRNIVGMMPHPERAARWFLPNRDGCVILNEFFYGQDYEAR